MHELTITQNILDISLAAARQQGATRIRTIRLKMGPFSGVVPECVQMYLDVLAQGTPAEGAKSRRRAFPCGFCAVTAAKRARSHGTAFSVPIAAVCG